jgi:hypothetical protein
MRSLGFTGTSRGMTDSQKQEFRDYLTTKKSEGFSHFHHGDCIGADAQAAAIAKDLGFYLICHPGLAKNPENTMFRAFTDFNDEVLEPKPFIKRDHDIVDTSECMVATPISCEEEISSGTWTTVRYARKKNKPVHIIYPPSKLSDQHHQIK